jgi:hypothetical protein
VCWVASSGMIGGFSPALVLGPVSGTSGGRVGWVGRGGPVNDDDEGELETGTDVVGGGTDTLGRDGVGLAGPPSSEEVQAAQDSTRNAANVQIRPTS